LSLTEGKNTFTISAKDMAGNTETQSYSVVYLPEKQRVKDKDKNGVFTRVLLSEMKKSNVPIHQVIRNVRSEVVKLARSIGHDQVPAIDDQVDGDFYFRK
jgi:hypothetical protein